jgi:Cysteine-rich CPXCG
VPQPLITRRVHCPYCAEPLQVQLDLSAGDQEYIEDCEVCCRPMLLRFSVDGDGLDFLDVSCSD